MKTKIFVVLLVCCIVALTLPHKGAGVVQAQTTQPMTEQELIAHLEAYYATHTLEEFVAETERLINAETDRALAEGALSATAVQNSEMITSYPWEGESIHQCIRRRKDACYHTYKAEVYTNGAAAFVGGAACIAGTVGTATALCFVGAIGAQTFLNLAANERRTSCDLTAMQDCYEKGSPGDGPK